MALIDAGMHTPVCCLATYFRCNPSTVEFELFMHNTLIEVVIFWGVIPTYMYQPFSVVGNKEADKFAVTASTDTQDIWPY